VNVGDELLIWKMPAFNLVPDEVDAAKYKSLIIDLRGNGGGYRDSSPDRRQHRSQTRSGARLRRLARGRRDGRREGGCALPRTEKELTRLQN
jgi:hypothetical protein